MKTQKLWSLWFCLLTDRNVIYRARKKPSIYACMRHSQGSVQETTVVSLPFELAETKKQFSDTAVAIHKESIG